MRQWRPYTYKCYI